MSRGLSNLTCSTSKNERIAFVEQSRLKGAVEKPVATLLNHGKLSERVVHCHTDHENRLCPPLVSEFNKKTIQYSYKNYSLKE